MSPIDQQQPEQSPQAQQTTFSPAPTGQPETGLQFTDNSEKESWPKRHRTIMVILPIISLFIVPGITTIPALIFIVYLAFAGGKTVYYDKTGLPKKRSTAERVFRGIGWLLLIIMTLIAGFIALIFIWLSQGDIKFG